MAQIKGKFLLDGAINGSKIQLEKDQALKGKLQNGSLVDIIKLGSSDEVLVKGVEVATKSMVETEKQRIDAILSASSADKDSFAEIVSLINSIDTTNDSAFAGYVSSNDAAVALKADKTYVDTQDALKADKTYVDTQLAAKADKSYVDTQDAKMFARDGSNGAAAAALNMGGYKIENLADGVASANAVNKGQLDATLVDAKAYTDTKIAAIPAVDLSGVVKRDGSTGAMTAALNMGGFKIENVADGVASANAVNKGQLDAVESALDGRLDIVEPKVTTLESKVSALEAKQFEKEKFTIGATLTHIDLAQNVVHKSLVVFVDRLALHATDDYTLSTVGGKTRITWAGSFASGGLEAIETGDVVNVTYYY